MSIIDQLKKLQRALRMVGFRQKGRKMILKEERAKKVLTGWDQKEGQVKISFHRVSL